MPLKKTERLNFVHRFEQRKSASACLVYEIFEHDPEVESMSDHSV